MSTTRACVAGFAALSILFAACVGDSTPQQQGVLDGPCFTDGSCNTGLTCTTVNGASKCVAGSDGSPTDANTTDTGLDAGPRKCTFQPTQFPCDQSPTCYGAAQGCSTTGCPGGPTDYKWDCFGPNQCGNTPCCIPDTAATLTPTTDCSQGGLKVTAVLVDGGAGFGIPVSVCGTGLACPAQNIQLCQFNTQCPTGTVCSPVKVSGSGTSANNVIIGACVPE